MEYIIAVLVVVAFFAFIAVKVRNSKRKKEFTGVGNGGGAKPGSDAKMHDQ